MKRRLLLIVKDVGWQVALAYLLYKFLPLPRISLRVRGKHATFPLWVRLGTSDIELFRNIHCKLEFSCIDDLRNPALIIDCGANAGYTVTYFLSKYPDAFVIAVEPDADNFATLQKNLAPFAGRFKLIQSGVWSKTTGLRISEIPFGDGKAWSKTVRETQPGEPAHMQAVTINKILAESNFDRISLLKIDIEGAEKEVFAGELEPWLSKTDALTIELHSDEGSRIFENAIRSQNFITFKSGELTVCKRA